MAYFGKLTNPQDQLNSEMASTIGKGLGSFMQHYQANKALEGIINEPGYKGLDPSEKIEKLAKLQGHGEAGEKMLATRLGIEQNAQQEKQQRSLAQAFEHYQRGEPIPAKISKDLPEEALFKFDDVSRSRKLGDEAYQSGIASGMPEALARHHQNMLSNAKKGEGLTNALKDYIQDQNRYKDLTGKDQTGARVPLTPEQRVKREEIGLSDTSKARQALAQKSEYARRGIANKKFAKSLLEGDEKIDDPLWVEFANRVPGGIKGKILSPKTQLYQSGLFEEFGVLKSMFPGQIRVKEIELLEDKLATLDKSHDAKKLILDNGIKKLQYDIILANAGAEVEREHPEAGSLEFDKLVHDKAQPQLDALYEDIIKEYQDIYKKHGKTPTGFVALEDQNGNLYEIPISEANKAKEEAKKQNILLKEVKR